MKPLAVYAFAVFVAIFSTAALSAEMPFNQAQFDAARATGQPAAVVFHADWCPTCRAQAPVFKDLSQSSELKSVTVYIANFDTETSLKKSLGVTKKSTVVVFKNGKESARSTGDTQDDSLTGLLRHAVSWR